MDTALSLTVRLRSRKTPDMGDISWVSFIAGWKRLNSLTFVSQWGMDMVVIPSFGKQYYLEYSMWFCKACHMYLEKGFKAETSISNNFCTTPVGFICWKTKFKLLLHISGVEDIKTLQLQYDAGKFWCIIIFTRSCKMLPFEHDLVQNVKKLRQSQHRIRPRFWCGEYLCKITKQY